MKDLKTWKRIKPECELLNDESNADDPVTLEVKTMTAGDFALYQASLVELEQGDPKAQTQALVNLVQNNVRNVQGLSADSTLIETGEQLVKCLDFKSLSEIATIIIAGSALKEDLGNVSSSPQQ